MLRLGWSGLADYGLQKWEGCTHARAPWKQRDGDPCSSQQVKAEGLPRADTMCMEHELASKAELEGNCDRRDADQQFCDGVEAQSLCRIKATDTSSQNASAPRADTQAGHKHREHDGDQGSGDAKTGHGEAAPNNFVGQGAKS